MQNACLPEGSAEQAGSRTAGTNACSLDFNWPFWRDFRGLALMTLIIDSLLLLPSM